MYQVDTEVTIAASCAEVWKHLIDFERYPEWNPFIRRLVGDPQIGSHLRARVQLAPLLVMSPKPTVVYFEPERYFAWRATVLGPFIMDAEHYFELQPRGAQLCQLRQGEIFSGLTARTLGPVVEALVRPQFEAMNEALRTRAEGRATSNRGLFSAAVPVQSASPRIEN